LVDPEIVGKSWNWRIQKSSLVLPLPLGLIVGSSRRFNLLEFLTRHALGCRRAYYAICARCADEVSLI